MQPERWQQLKKVFEAVCELEPEQRCAFLDQACAADPELRHEVESILAAGERVPALFDSPALAAFSDLLAQEHPEALIGRRVGPYRLTRLIASGGMGTVYHASRADGQFDQEVAVKFIKSGLVTGDCRQRFRRERQTLARLDHPSIARLLDGGETPDGLPYLVMEYVGGKPINVYCDERRLSTIERLELFRTVCSAVHYAHQNLVVHRDLKPSNIFVTPDGVPKLLDFGIAKVLEPEPAPEQAGLPRTIQPRMTPEYASPEQVRGEPITTATDVYSLGVVLYELLTGYRPYRVKSRSLHDLARTICEDEPERPSTAVRRVDEVTTTSGGDRLRLTPQMISQTRDGQPDKLRRQLLGDVDAIVLTALHKQPQRRYVSVEQFSEDIRRHLDGLPVIAHESTFRYRSAKFIGRHRAAVVAASVVVVSLLAGIVATTRAARVADRGRDAALRAQQFAQQEAANAIVEARKSECVTKFLQTVLASANPANQRREITVREVLDQASGRVAAEFGADPEVESAVRTAIGETYIGLGRYDDAEPHLRAALEIQRKIHGAEHWDVAKSLNNLGVLLHAKGDLAGAEKGCSEALTMHRKLYGEEHPDVASDLNNLGVVVRARGDDVRAEKLLRQALAIRRKLFGEENVDVAETLNNLANLLRGRGDLDAAVPLCREVLAMRRKLLGNQHPDVAQSLDNLAVVLAAKGDYDAAKPLFREALALYRKLLGNDHPDVAVTLNNLGHLLHTTGDSTGAEPLLRECLDIRRRTLPAGDPRTSYSASLLGACLVALRRYDEAEPLLLEAYTDLRATLGDHHQRTEYAARTIAELYEALGRPDDAARYRAMLSASQPASPAQR